MHLRKIRHDLKRQQSILIMFSIGLIGLLTLLITHASTSTVAIDPENGTFSLGATREDLNSVSFVHFKATTSGNPTGRDAFVWPYSKYSIWNMPIGSGADYQPANLQTPNALDPDLALILRDTPGNATIGFHDSNYAWSPYSSRCGSNTGPSWNLTIPPITSSLFAKGGNNHVSIFSNNLSNRIDIETAALCNGGSTIGGGSDLQAHPLNDMGTVGLQGGSGLPATGGSIRKEEMQSGTDIHHSLAMILEGWKYLQKCNNQGGGKNDTFRWPAQWSDSYACSSDGYGGTKDYFRMGSLLALPTPGKTNGVDINTLGLQTEMGKKIAKALQNYGVYVADDSYGTPGDNSTSYMGFKVSVDALQFWNDSHNGEVFLDDTSTAVGQDMQKIIPKLYVVANNGPTSIGGPGSRIACYAPPFTNLTDAVTTNPNSGNPAQPAGCP